MGCELSKVYKIDIILDNPLRVYSPLDNVSGKVRIQVEEDTIIHSCTIECNGIGKTKWPTKNERGQKGSSSHFSNYKLNDEKQYSFKESSGLNVAGERLTDVNYRRFILSKNSSLLANVIDSGEVEDSEDPTRDPNANSLLSYLEEQNVCLRPICLNNLPINLSEDKMTDPRSENSDKLSSHEVVYFRQKVDLLRNYAAKSEAIQNQSRSSSYLGSLDKTATTKREFLISRGIHLFNFEFKLPSNLPTSFVLPEEYSTEQISAQLRYYLKVMVANFDANVTHTKEVDIVIYRPLDLRTIPCLKDRVTIHKEFMIPSCWTFTNRSGGSIKCDFSLNKTGFVPGETILPEIFIKNSTSKNIETITLRFLQILLLIGKNNDHHIEVLRLFSTRLTSKNRTNVSSFEHVQVHLKPKILNYYNCILAKGRHKKKGYRVHNCALPGYGSTAHFVDKIHIPPVPCTGLDGKQSLIHLEYAVVLKMRLEGDSSNGCDLRVNIPVTIGSHPTKETSFSESESVEPCFGNFNYKSGEVIEYNEPKDADEMNDYQPMTPVYKYYKPKFLSDENMIFRSPCFDRGRQPRREETSRNNRKNRHYSSSKHDVISETEDPFFPRSLSNCDLTENIKAQNYDESSDSSSCCDSDEVSSNPETQSIISSECDDVIQDSVEDRGFNQKLLNNLYRKHLSLQQENKSKNLFTKKTESPQIRRIKPIFSATARYQPNETSSSDNKKKPFSSLTTAEKELASI